MRAPDDLLPAVLDGAARTRRRPAWATSERWISMETRARLGAVPRTAIDPRPGRLLTVFAAGAYTVGAGGYAAGADRAGRQRPHGVRSDGDIWVMKPDGTARKQLTSGPTDDQGPTWSRDGTRLAYWSQDAEAGRAELINVAADGSDPTVVTTVEGDHELHPADWSPDGTQLAFTTCPRTDQPSCELLAAAADGSGTDSLAEPSIATWTIRWSPDGSLVAFGGSRDDEQRSVRVISPEDGTERELGLLTNREDAAFSGLEWSPDGQKIVTQGGDVQPGIWVIPVEGGAGIRLADDGIFPVWSPDGESVAYLDGGERVYIVPAGGGEARTDGTELRSPGGVVTRRRRAGHPARRRHRDRRRCQRRDPRPAAGCRAGVVAARRSIAERRCRPGSIPGRPSVH